TIYFFFQAEDGIRAGHVTGVQTCALPISSLSRSETILSKSDGVTISSSPGSLASISRSSSEVSAKFVEYSSESSVLDSGKATPRSEERRVGKECGSRSLPYL